MADEGRERLNSPTTAAEAEITEVSPVSFPDTQRIGFWD